MTDKIDLVAARADLSMHKCDTEGSVLVVCAHPDDECIGAGGTIVNHVRDGLPVDVLCLTGDTTRNRELEAACGILGIRRVYTSNRDDFDINSSAQEQIVHVILECRPTVIITHSVNDYNQNHTACSRIVDRAVEWASHRTLYSDAHRVREIYRMEINSLLNRPHVLVDITDSYETALLALQQHRSQISKTDGFYLRFYDARTRLRGVQAACERAEAFSVSRPIHAGPFYPQNSVRRLL